jgi:hypothetical protein
MVVSFVRNGADCMDGALVKFEAADLVAKNGTVELPEVEVKSRFDHLIVSWNASTPAGSSLTAYAQARVDGNWTKWYNMGIWNTSGCAQRRTSVTEQQDEHGTIDTDILKLDKLADAFKVKVELSGEPRLRFASVNVIDSSLHSVDVPPNKQVWGTELDVPALAQISVEGGRGWCSPTSVTMLLHYWARKLDRPELAVGITENAQGCHDEAWGGTGNWPFNTARAAELGGIRAYITRFVSVSQIERWIQKRVPVIVSIHSSRLRREDSETDSGHLMVVRGFTSDGDPIFNDPWPLGGKAEDPPRDYPIEDLRKVFKREDLEYAWLGPNGSWGTVYLIYPETM